MIPAENIRDWRGRAVVDAQGKKIGELEAVYVDTASDEPSFVTVKVGGLLGKSRLVFVPLDGAMVSPDHVRVTVDRDQSKSAPAIDTDGELVAEMEPSVFAYYGIDYQPGASGERRLARR
ncbi:MAG: PRC-barrel domain-containing protein [Frankiaceae bacterium]